MAEKIEVIPPQIPKEVDEIIRQYGDIITTYKHIVEVWAQPPTFLYKGEANEQRRV